MAKKKEEKVKSVGTWSRTGKVQTEMTPTGVITVAEEKNRKMRATRWTQIGYTSIVEKEVEKDGKPKMMKVIDGPIGFDLLDEETKKKVAKKQALREALSETA